MAVFASAALSVTSVASAAPINTMVSFGDSLSDPGNALFFTKDIPSVGAGTLFLNVLAVPPQNVDSQGHFSNGPTAVEYLAGSLGLATTRGWQTPYAAGVATNYAVGGALTGGFPLAPATGLQHLSGLTGFVPGLATSAITSQVAKFLADPHVFNPATTLFTIQGGGNDIFMANALGLTGGDMFTVVDTATTHLASSIAALAGAGAHRILWMTLPDISLTPFGQAGDTAGLFGLTNLFNGLLAGKVAQVDAAFGGILDLIEVDTAGFMRDASTNPALPLSMTAPPCVFIPGPGGLPGCDGLFFHDGVHPTTAAHALFANVLFRAVPEPQSLALVLLALGALVAGQRRRRQPAALQSA